MNENIIELPILLYDDIGGMIFNNLIQETCRWQLTAMYDLTNKKNT